MKKSYIGIMIALILIPTLSYAINEKYGELDARSYPEVKLIQLITNSTKVTTFLDVQYQNVCYETQNGLSCVKL